MKIQTLKYVSAAILSAIVGASINSVILQPKIGKLENDLADVRANLQLKEHEVIYFRKQLIKHGNPESWKINGDGIYNMWYERANDFGTGVTMEYMNCP